MFLFEQCILVKTFKNSRLVWIEGQTSEQSSLLQYIVSVKTNYNTLLHSLELQDLAVFIESSDDADVNEGLRF